MSVFAPIVDQVRESFQRSSRTGPIVRFVWHHQASTNDDATIDMMVSGSREVSATYTIDNKDYGGRGWARITGVVSEDYRPWTSSSQLVDGQALTVECANLTGDPSWSIAPESSEACARLAAYAFTQYGVPLKRITSSADPTGHVGHCEIPNIWPGQSYPTFCQGHLNIDAILKRANEIVSGDTGYVEPPSLTELGMFMLATSGGVYLVGAGYSKGLTAEEYGQVQGIPGIGMFDASTNDRQRDVILSACMDGLMAMPKAIPAGPASASAPQSMPPGDEDDHDH